jgi:hypothetical protein
MRVTPLELEGLKSIELVVHADERGFFVERFHSARFAAQGLPTSFVQDNHSRSAPGVLRGLQQRYIRGTDRRVGGALGSARRGDRGALGLTTWAGLERPSGRASRLASTGGRELHLVGQ